MANLSKHFTQAEFEFSINAVRRGISNVMTALHKASAVKLCVKVLEPIRAYYNAPTKILSGYRSDLLNKLTKGSSKTSQHPKGEAGDIEVEGISQQQLYKDIKTGKIKIEFDQLIDEFGSWVHISYREGHNRRQCLKARVVNGRTVYTPDN